MLSGMGVETGIDLDLLCDASARISSLVGHDLPSKYLKAHLGRRVRAGRQPSATPAAATVTAATPAAVPTALAKDAAGS